MNDTTNLIQTRALRTSFTRVQRLKFNFDLILLSCFSYTQNDSLKWYRRYFVTFMRASTKQFRLRYLVFSAE